MLSAVKRVRRSVPSCRFLVESDAAIHQHHCTTRREQIGETQVWRSIGPSRSRTQTGDGQEDWIWKSVGPIRRLDCRRGRHRNLTRHLDALPLGILGTNRAGRLPGSSRLASLDSLVALVGGSDTPRKAKKAKSPRNRTKIIERTIKIRGHSFGFF